MIGYWLSTTTAYFHYSLRTKQANNRFIHKQAINPAIIPQQSTIERQPNNKVYLAYLNSFNEFSG